MIPKLIALGKENPESMPAFIVTSSMLPIEPIPQLFVLSLVKAAQRNLMHSLSLTYAPQGIHLGLINIGGPVSPSHKLWNPKNIALQAWEWFANSKTSPRFEVKI
jgi:NAD(P)-dependent dehydrogenase (short-subunit alcohol dehydrogenase family)